MRIKDIRLWLNRAACIVWVDSGADYDDSDLPLDEMDLSVTTTIGIPVKFRRDRRYGYQLIIEHETQGDGFPKKKYSGVWCKAILSISNKKPK
jgi:hypothetical protein